MLMHLSFNPEKAVQSAAVLLRREGKRMSRLRLLKLLIIADRECLRKTGRPILGSKIVAMDNGPLHSDIYDLIKGNHVDEPLWSQYIRCSGPRDVILSKEPPIGKLARHEIDILTETSDKYSLEDDYTLSMLTHVFPEFIKNYHPNTSTPISLEDVIGEVRASEKPAILQDLQDDMNWEHFFADLEK
jgi:uncharacterized phage-associated protein